MAEHKVAQIQNDMVALRVQLFNEFSASVEDHMQFLANYLPTMEADLPRLVNFKTFFYFFSHPKISGVAPTAL